MTVEPPEGDGKTIAQIIEDIWQNRDRDYNIRLPGQAASAHRQGDDRRGPRAVRRVHPRRRRGAFAEDLPSAAAQSLRRHDEDCCATRTSRISWSNYPRGERTFIVAHERHGRRSASEWLIRGGDGKEYKPETTSRPSPRSSASNTDEIEAIAHPAVAAAGLERRRRCVELREALTQAPEHFTEANLQQAPSTSRYSKALVDIISMVKHAAVDTSPLLTAEERVEPGRRPQSPRTASSPRQQAKWMDHIRQHLVANLSIDREDFEAIPVLSDHGGWGRANRVFDGELAELLARTQRGAGGGMTDVVGKLWGFCHTLRHDGVDYGDYIEQITYLLFLKMADERGIELPDETPTGPTCASRAAPTCSTPTSRPSAPWASSPACSATSSAARRTASPTRSTSTSSSA